MIKDLKSGDTQKLIRILKNKLYEKANEYFTEETLKIAQRNQEIRKSPLLTFTFGGKVYQYETGVIRFPQSLAECLYKEMHELVMHRRRIIEEEGAYINAALVAACSRCESATHLYQLLPDLMHPILKAVGIDPVLSLSFVPLTEEQVNEFKLKHHVNLDMLFQRATRNALGAFL